MLFVRNKKARSNLPIGVYRFKDKYRSSCSVFGKNIRKDFKDPISAFEEYKRVKEKYVKFMAEKYKDEIPENLYNAMMMFEVKIDD